MLTTEDIKKLTSLLATKEDFKEVKSDIASLKSDMKDVKGDVASLKSDMKDVKGDVASLKTELDEFKDSTTKEFTSIRSELKEFKDSTEREFISLRSDIKEIKEDVAGLRESLQGMIVAVDNLTKVITDLRMEYVSITYQLKRHEDWIKQIAEKAGVKLVV
jgi:predicted  nucleic acid-binding Zn-ribbon protein